jgi:hypothetical protein
LTFTQGGQANGRDLLARVGQRDARFHAADHPQEPLSARPLDIAPMQQQPRLEVVRDAGILRKQQAEAGRHHANHRGGLVIDLNRAADNRRIATKAPAP